MMIRSLLSENVFFVNSNLIMILLIKNLLLCEIIKISCIVFKFYFFITFLSVLNQYFRHIE